MRWSIARLFERQDPFEAHEWFAWYPIVTDQGIVVFLETVTRKLNIRPGREYGYWDYKLKN